MEQQEFLKQLPHERLKQELCAKFTPSNTYIGSHIIHTISTSSFKIKQEGNILSDEDVKKGDVFWYYETSKPRPAVVISVDKKTNICNIMKLTSTDNIHNTLISVNSRFARDGFYAYGFDIVKTEYVARNFFFHIEDKKNLNIAIKNNKSFFNIK